MKIIEEQDDLLVFLIQVFDDALEQIITGFGFSDLSYHFGFLRNTVA